MQRGKTNPRLAMHLIAAQPSVFARMIERAGVEAELGFRAHPHMLRHACG
jgi:integrase